MSIFFLNMVLISFTCTFLIIFHWQFNTLLHTKVIFMKRFVMGIDDSFRVLVSKENLFLQILRVTKNISDTMFIPLVWFEWNYAFCTGLPYKPSKGGFKSPNLFWQRRWVNEQFFSYIIERTSYIQWHDDDVCFVLDQQS